MNSTEEKPRQFPILRDHTEKRPMPKFIPWSVAEKAYSIYCTQYGGSGQSLERVAERGGFAASEMDMFYPGWLTESSEITALQEQLKRAQVDRDALKAFVEQDEEIKEQLREQLNAAKAENEQLRSELPMYHWPQYVLRQHYEKKLKALELERDLAIAHDTQPYPTAWAYEQACKALTVANAKLEKAMLEKAISALKSAKGFVDAGDNVGLTKIKVDETLCELESAAGEVK